MKFEIPDDIHEVISHNDESIPLFESKFLDFFSRVKWWIVPLIYVPVIAYFIYTSFVDYGFGWQRVLLSFFGGLAIWTVIEYVFHRFIFHYNAESKAAKTFFFIMHGVHHAFPADSLRLVLPPSISIPLSTMFFFLFKLVFGGIYAPIFAGFIFGYVCYDMIHYATHHAHFIKFDWFKRIKQHHMMHHFKDPDNGFGVTSDLWDKVLRTEIKS